jgi:NADPH:quinone reductase-like Zn-dependent oxidoreductase
MMQAVHAIKPGSHDDPVAGAELVELPIPEPKQGEVLIKVLLRVVNPVELYTLMGHYEPALPIENWPIVPGIDGMGVVHKLGPGNCLVSIRPLLHLKAAQL